MEIELTKEEKKVLAQLRAKGFAITLWYPDELRSVPPRKLEQALVVEGNEYIAFNGKEG